MESNKRNKLKYCDKGKYGGRNEKLNKEKGSEMRRPEKQRREQKYYEIEILR